MAAGIGLQGSQVAISSSRMDSLQLRGFEFNVTGKGSGLRVYGLGEHFFRRKHRFCVLFLNMESINIRSHIGPQNG